MEIEGHMGIFIDLQAFGPKVKVLVKEMAATILEQNPDMHEVAKRVQGDVQVGAEAVALRALLHMTTIIMQRRGMNPTDGIVIERADRGDVGHA